MSPGQEQPSGESDLATSGKTEHTPGPWTADESEVFDGDGWCLAETRPTRGAENGYSPEELANARLIAAAPDLAVLLARATNLLEGENRSTDRPSSYISAFVREARAAIAKATGAA